MKRKDRFVAKVNFKKAFFIKLGRGACWETDSIANARLRRGWSHQSLDDINSGRWEPM